MIVTVYQQSFTFSRFFLKSGEHSRALRHLLKYAATSQDDAEALNLAVEVVASSPSDEPHLTRSNMISNL